MIDYHRGLLFDDLRMSGYREAIGRAVRPGDVVIDLGCGSGVLSLFACEAGARKVYAIEHTHMADVARVLVRRAGLEDRIEIVHDLSTLIDLPERADVLVTETIGSFAFDEQILSAVLDARARLLAPGARVLPRRLTLSAAAAELPADYQHIVASWSERRYGIDFSPLRVFEANALHHVHAGDETRLSEGAGVIDADLETVESETLQGGATLVARRDGIVHGFVVWFTATLTDGVTLTSREERGTHWSQGFLPLESPVVVTRGTEIDLELDTNDGRLWRWQGRVGGASFDQTSGFSMPPCSLTRRN